jgi:Xaa-Pro aminopeptidase
MTPSANDVTEKLARVRAWLAAVGCGDAKYGDAKYGGALFASQPGVAWVTGGLEDKIVRNEEPGLVWALVTADDAYLITTNIEAARLSAEADTGAFTLRAVPWYDAGGLAGEAERLVRKHLGTAALADAGGGAAERRLVSGPLVTDSFSVPFGVPLPGELATLRLPLTGHEQARLAELGRDTARALEGALRDWRPEQRERDVAARIAAALEERGILPSVLLVGGAERRRAFRHPVPTAAVTGNDVLAVVTGVRGGLNVACSRSASAGEPEPGLAAGHAAACAVETALIAATRPGVTWERALAAGQAAYAEAGYAGEWREHVQGGPIGYLSQEFDVVPGAASAAAVIAAGTAYSWNPTVRGAKSEDTFIVAPGAPPAGAIGVSNTPDWPQVAGGRPGILPV